MTVYMIHVCFDSETYNVVFSTFFILAKKVNGVTTMSLYRMNKNRENWHKDLNFRFDFFSITSLTLCQDDECI